jgi:hypothetical protein
MVPSGLYRAVSLVLVVVALSRTLPGPTAPVAAQADTVVATLAAGMSVEPLFATVIPAAALPDAPLQDFLLWHATIEPGVTVVVPAEYGRCCPGPLITHVLAGELTLRVEGPLQIVRASTTATPEPTEAVPPATEVVVRPGETAVGRFELPATYTNAGAAPLQLLGGAFLGGSAPGPAEGYQLRNFVELVPTPPLPPGPLTLELVRVHLPPGAELAAVPAGALRLAMRESGAGILERRAEGTVANIGRNPVVVAVLTLFPRAGAGTLMP